MVGREPSDRLAWAWANWRPLSSLILALSSFVMGIIPQTRQYALTPLSAAILSLVIMVWHLDGSRGKGHLGLKKYSGGLQDAFDDIRKAIEAALRDHRALNVKVVGCRLSDINSVVGRLLGTPRQGVNLEFYHIDDRFLEEAPWPRSKQDAVNLRSTIDELKSRLSVAKGVTYEFYSYRMHPVFYGCIVGEEVVFWGYFYWSRERGTYVGPQNPCFRIARGEEGFVEILEWCLNRCSQWSAQPVRDRQGPEPVEGRAAIG